MQLLNVDQERDRERGGGGDAQLGANGRARDSIPVAPGRNRRLLLLLEPFSLLTLAMLNSKGSAAPKRASKAQKPGATATKRAQAREAPLAEEEQFEVSAAPDASEIMPAGYACYL